MLSQPEWLLFKRSVSETGREQNKKKPAQPKEEEPAKKEEMKNTLVIAQGMPFWFEKEYNGYLFGNKIDKFSFCIVVLTAHHFSLFSFFYTTVPEKKNHLEKISFIIKLIVR
ncbi:MAG: hypothetical protein D3909_06560 [Candidatus Electrothrix sp. ATG1]|nr:hypothetical protein [Candidatus Electrothrix sp. ATG1]